MKAFFASLKEEIKVKWKELLILVLINLFELFALSSLLINMKLYGVILVSLALLLPVLILFIFAIKERKPDKQDIKILFLFIGLSLLFGIVKSYLYVISLLIAYLFYKDKKSMYKWLFYISVTCFALFIFLTLIRVLPEVALLRHNEAWTDITHIRHTFGFNHPNHPLKYVLAITVFGYMHLGDSKKNTLIFSIIMLIVTLWFAWLTNCRTGLLVITGLLIIMNLPFLVSWFKTKRLFFGFILASFVMIAFRNVREVNILLSGRPYWFDFFFKNFSEYVLFGKYYLVNIITNFNVNSFVEYPLDNDFLMTIFDGGLLALLAITYLFYMAFEHNTDRKVTVALIGLFMYGLTEAFELAFTYPVFIMMFVELLDRYYKHKDKIKLLKDKNKEIEKASE